MIKLYKIYDFYTNSYRLVDSNIRTIIHLHIIIYDLIKSLISFYHFHPLRRYQSIELRSQELGGGYSPILVLVNILKCSFFSLYFLFVKLIHCMVLFPGNYTIFIEIIGAKIAFQSFLLNLKC